MSLIFLTTSLGIGLLAPWCRDRPQLLLAFHADILIRDFKSHGILYGLKMATSYSQDRHLTLQTGRGKRETRRVLYHGSEIAAEIFSLCVTGIT